MSRAPATPRTSPIDDVETVLAALADEHAALLDAARAHRDALRTADLAAVKAASDRTLAILERIGTLEERRCRLVGAPPPRLARSAPTAPATGLTITALAQHCPAEQRERLLSLGTRLRELIDAVRAEHAAVRAASEQLAIHMRGILQQLAQGQSHAGTYSASARVEPGRTQILHALDLRS
jgi:hypothetical protein